MGTELSTGNAEKVFVEGRKEGRERKEEGGS